MICADSEDSEDIEKEREMGQEHGGRLQKVEDHEPPGGHGDDCDGLPARQKFQFPKKGYFYYVSKSFAASATSLCPYVPDWQCRLTTQSL